MLTPLQKQAAQAIVNLFETGHVRGNYSQITVVAGDAGHLTYGRSQTTLASGNLAILVERYVADPAAVFGQRLSSYLPRLRAKDLTLDQDRTLANLLRTAADDPVMRSSQDAFFDDTYWAPAAREADKRGIQSALGTAVVYDSTVHGSWKTLANRTTAAAGALATVGERAWVKAYVATRRDWLANHKNPVLRPTVYRMDAFARLMDQGHWDLDLPLVVRGEEISTATLQGLPAGCFDGPALGSRTLALQTPVLKGADVRRLQLALSDQGADILADGFFGPTSVRLLKAYQTAQKLPATGVADPALIAKLVG